MWNGVIASRPLGRNPATPSCVMPVHDEPNIPTCPVLHGWAAAQPTTCAPADPHSFTSAMSLTPPEQPLPG